MTEEIMLCWTLFWSDSHPWIVYRELFVFGLLYFLISSALNKIEGDKMINNNKKAVLHVAKAQTGMTESEYRDLLGSVGVTSSADLDMNNAKFDQVMSRFEELGFRTTSKPRSKRNVSNLPKNKKKLMKKLEAILLDLDLHWSYVDSIARSRFGKDAVQWLEGEELFKLVQMMVMHQKRQHKKKEAM